MNSKMGTLETSERIPLIPGVHKYLRNEPSKGRQTLVLCACMYVHFMSMGFTSVLGVLYVELIRQFNSTRSEAAVVQSLYQGLTYVGGILFSGVVTRAGVGLPVILASVSGGAALFISAFSVNIYMVIALVGFVGGLSMSINYLCGFVAVGWMFVSNRRAALAFLTMATAVGQTALPYVADFFINVYGWPGTFMIASGLILNSVPCGLLLYFSKDYLHKQTDPGTSSSNVNVCQCSSRQDIAFIMFVFVCLIFPGTGAVESWFTVDLSELRGFGRQAGTVLLSFVGAFGLIGRFLGTIVLKFYPHVNIGIPLAICFEFFAISHFIVISFTDYFGMLGGIFVRGISIGIIMCLMPGMQLELRGVHRFPRTVSLCNLVSGFGLVVCGYLGGSIADWTGGYELAFYIASGVGVFCGLVMVIIICLK